MILLESVSKTYEMGEGVVRALDHVDLQVDQGDFLAIVGPSGSGKSTLMNILGLLDVPDEGRYLLDGMDVGALSGGQQQRVAIARALVCEPEIILADEPTGALDSRTGVEIMELFKSLHAEGQTVILITHNQELADEAQRVVRIADGLIQEMERGSHAV